MFDLRHIRHLQAVARHSTLQAAADAIHITQPALTQSIARLEDAMGARLFDRRGRKLELTELGERLVARGEDLLRYARDMEEEVALWQGMGTGEVAIGIDPEAELSLLPAVLEEFVPHHPSVKVTVRSGHTAELLPPLLRGELHFLVTDAEILQDREDLDIQALAPDPIAVAVRPDHPLAHHTDPEPAEVVQYPFAGASTAPRFDRWKAEHGRKVETGSYEPSLICDNYEVLVRLAENSNSLVFGPAELLRDYEKAGRLAIMPWPIAGPDIQSCVIRTRGRQLSPAAEKLIELFTA